MNTTLVSIIIPTYNRAHLISETLDSVLAQTYTNWECIVVDDGSTDNTFEVINSYVNKDARFQYHHRPVDRLAGGNAARNYGFEVSKGEYVVFFDSDDLFADFCLYERVNLVKKYSNVDLLIRDTSRLTNNDKKQYSINKDPKIIDKEEYLRMFIKHNIPWPIMGALYKRSLLLDCKFDEDLKRFQDVSFNIKVLSRFNEISLLRDYKIDSYYRVEENKNFNKAFLNKVLDAYLVFCNINSKLLVEKDYKSDIRIFSSKIILDFIIPFFEQNKTKSNQVFKWFFKSKIYNLNQKILVFILMVLLNFKLFKVKGIGMNRFRKIFKSKIQ